MGAKRDQAEAKLKIEATRQLRKQGLNGELTVKHACGTVKGMEVWGLIENDVPVRAELLEGELIAFEYLADRHKKAA